MSRTIDISNPKKLSEADRRYLAERGRLPEGAEPVSNLAPGFEPVAGAVHTGDANTLGLTREELDAKLERLAELEAQEIERNLEKDRAEFARHGSPIGDDEYTYADKDEDDLRQELSSRGLDPNGNRKAMRSRLVKDDRSKASGSN